MERASESSIKGCQVSYRYSRENGVSQSKVGGLVLAPQERVRFAELFYIWIRVTKAPMNFM